MNKEIENEIKRFKEIANQEDENLTMTILTDIMGHLAEIKEDKEGKQNIDFSNFDKNVSNIKKLISSFPTVNIDAIKDTENFKNLIKNDLDMAEKIKNECEISIRELTWAKDLLDKENKENEENA